MSDKTEAPTQGRLAKARREGNVAVSSALLQAVGLLVALALAPSVIQATAARAAEMLRTGLERGADAATLSPAHVGIAAMELSAPILLAVACVVALVGGVQTRGLVAPSRIAPDLSRMSPLSLVRNLFSAPRVFAILRALVTMLIVGYLVVRRLSLHMVDLARSTGRIEVASVVAGELAISIARDVVLVLLALAIVDLIVVRHSWLSRLKMTKSEVQREHRENEGDPHMKAARERAHHEMMAAAAVNAVRDATVVIVNPQHLATALRYRGDEDEAPVLVAKGEGELAKRIVDAARAYGVPVVQDIPIARALFELTEGDAIPAELYEAVAIILRDVQEQAEG